MTIFQGVLKQKFLWAECPCDHQTNSVDCYAEVTNQATHSKSMTSRVCSEKVHHGFPGPVCSCVYVCVFYAK